MLKDFAKAKRPEDDALSQEVKQAREKLGVYQTKIKEAKLPVMVIFEGWGASGKGSVIGRVIRSIDPRFFVVRTLAEPTAEDMRYPFLHRYMKEIPEAGKFAFFDAFWMEEVVNQKMQGIIDEKTYARRVKSINTTERSLTDNGYLVMKFFFQFSKKEQKKRLRTLQADKNTRWRVSESDLHQNKHYDEYLDMYDKYLEDTRIDTALKNHSLAAPIRQNTFPLNHTPYLSEITLADKVISDQEYRKELDRLQKKLHALHNELYRRKIPVIIAYEGWDAAGKGGNIKRITAALDPRGFEVLPIASPEPHEKARHFLWRFWTRLPKDGHIAIFDRTEKELAEWGAVVIKFWVQIDNATQLARFTDRQNTPEKQWKITDEDWRNREKWDLYEEAINEMLQKTNTTFAPWYILESNDKKYARIKALRIVVDSLKQACKEK